MRKSDNKIAIVIALNLLLLLLSSSYLTSVGLPHKLNEFIAVPSGGCYTGIFPGYQTVFDVEKLVGKKMAIVLSFTDRWGPPYYFPKGYCDVLWETDHLPLITWQPTLASLQEIIDGRWDRFIEQWARDARDYGHPLMIRWGHEMNGDWYPWSGVRNGGGRLTGFGNPQEPDGPERYVAAYRHIHDSFEEMGASNVIWVWAPNEGNPVGTSWNEVENYYPGDEYVDWLGMDGYNWGTSRPWSRWRSFDEIFGEFYRKLSKLASDKPIMIAEFASTEDGGDKAQWITDAFRRIKTAYPQIKAFVWFNLTKETSWAMDSSPESLEAFRQALQDPYYVGELMLKEDR